VKAIIAAQLTDKEIIKLADSLKLEKVDELPYHLTLFAVEILNDKKRELEQVVAEISKSFCPRKTRITGIETTSYGTARFSLENSAGLQELHEEIVKRTSVYRDVNAFSKANQHRRECTEEEQGLIELYGRLNVMQRFRPHITIGRTTDKIEGKGLDMKINIDNVTVYYII
jgi:2'-5' RNA ligase